MTLMDWIVLNCCMEIILHKLIKLIELNLITCVNFGSLSKWTKRPRSIFTGTPNKFVPIYVCFDFFFVAPFRFALCLQTWSKKKSDLFNNNLKKRNRINTNCIFFCFFLSLDLGNKASGTVKIHTSHAHTRAIHSQHNRLNFDHYAKGRKPEISLWKRWGHWIAINRGFHIIKKCMLSKEFNRCQNVRMRLAEESEREREKKYI